MKGRTLKTTAFLALILVLGAVGLAACTAAPAPTTPSYTINVATSPTLGQYLVDGKGMTLYWTTADAPNTSNVKGDTLKIWPIFYTAVITVPSSLEVSNISLISRTDDGYQTNYKSWPLYYYAQDTAPGDTNGQGVVGRWSVVNPAASGPQPVSQ